MRKGLLAAFILASAFLAAAAGIAALAADTAVVFEEESPDLPKGHIYIRSLFEKAYETGLTVELIAEFEGGAIHEYSLNKDNLYAISDDVAVGDYRCVVYATDKNADVRAEYGGDIQTVRENNATCFLVVAGRGDFVSQYRWLSGFRDQNGNYVTGSITREEAAGYFQGTIARQDPSDADDAEKEEIEQAEAGWDQPEETPQQANPVPQQDEGNTAKVPSGIAICAIVIALILAALLYRRHKH